MRGSTIVALLCLSCMSVVSQAQSPVIYPPATYPSVYAAPMAASSCGCAVAAPVVQSACSTCNTCDNGCGGACGGGCGGSICSNPTEFYNRLYSDFYANNPWYVAAKEKENAERHARLFPKPEPQPVKPEPKTKAPAKSVLDKPVTTKTTAAKTIARK